MGSSGCRLALIIYQRHLFYFKKDTSCQFDFATNDTSSPQGKREQAPSFQVRCHLLRIAALKVSRSPGSLLKRVELSEREQKQRHEVYFWRVACLLACAITCLIRCATYFMIELFCFFDVWWAATNTARYLFTHQRSCHAEMAVGQNQWYHFGVCEFAAHFRTYFSG